MFDHTRLDPDFADRLEIAILAAKREEVFMVPYCGERDVWEQARLWRQSRSTGVINRKLEWLRSHKAHFIADVIEEVGPQAGRWATNAIPGMSWHQWGLACDLYWDRNGDEPGGVEWNDLAGYKRFAEIARDRAELTSGFFWRSRDAVHVQRYPDPSPNENIKVINDIMRERYVR